MGASFAKIEHNETRSAHLGARRLRWFYLRPKVVMAPALQ
jgi:hypothetical protein